MTVRIGNFMRHTKPKISTRSGQFSKRTVHLRPELNLHIADFKPRETMKMNFADHYSCLRFAFYLQGNGYIKRCASNGTVTLKKVLPIKRCSSVSFSPELEGTICFQAGHHQSHLTIHISPPLLNTFIGGRFRRIPHDLDAISNGCDTINFFHSGPLSPVMDAVIHQLIACPYSGPLGQMYQESKAIELIAHKLAQIAVSTEAVATSNELRLDDIERVHHAKDILISDLENPPKLFELSYAVGTTHTQLNRGFRKIYGTSVFGYLRKMRLEKARHLLEKGRMNVTETAFAVGYNSLSSFSRAFSAHFGLNPVSYLKEDRSIEYDYAAN